MPLDATSPGWIRNPLLYPTELQGCNKRAGLWVVLESASMLESLQVGLE